MAEYLSATVRYQGYSLKALLEDPRKSSVTGEMNTELVKPGFYSLCKWGRDTNNIVE